MPGTQQGTPRNTALRKAYGAASQDLREAHREEFDKMYEARAAELGVEWHPRPTAEQRAEEELRRIMAEHPEAVRAVLGDGATTPDEV